MVPGSVPVSPAQALSPNRPDRHATQSLLLRGTDETIPCTRPAIADALHWGFLKPDPQSKLDLPFAVEVGGVDVERLSEGRRVCLGAVEEGEGGGIA